MFSRIHGRPIVIGAALLLTSGAQAVSYIWNAVDDLYQWPGNWIPLGIPGAGDVVIFDQDPNSDVFFLAGTPVSNERLIVRRGAYTFIGNDDAHTYTAPWSIIDGNWGFQIGTTGTASLILDGPASHTMQQLVVGEGPSSNGTLTVQNGSSVSATRVAHIGGAGVGLLSVRNGGSFEADEMWIAKLGAGHVSVAGGVVTTDGDLRVGLSAPGSLGVTSGFVDVGGDMIIGSNAAGTGDVVLEGLGSANVAGELRVADAGSGSITVLNAQVTAQTTQVGAASGTGWATVCDGGVLETDDLEVGGFTTSAGFLTVCDGGTVSARLFDAGAASELWIGGSPAAKLRAQHVTVTGIAVLAAGNNFWISHDPAAQFETGFSISGGQGGDTSTLFVYPDGQLATPASYVGTQPGASASVYVHGQWEAEQLTIGDAQASYGTIAVYPTGTLSVAQPIEVKERGNLTMFGGSVGAPLITLDGGYLIGSGVVYGHVANPTGQIVVGGYSTVGDLSIEGDGLSLTTSGALAFDIDGPSSSDNLLVTGPISLGGTLYVNENGYTAPTGAFFEIITGHVSHGITGTFDEVIPLGTWDVLYGIDSVLVMKREPCLTDFDGSGHTGFDDLMDLLSGWGPCAGCAWDLDGSGHVGFDDLGDLLNAWGEC